MSIEIKQAELNYECAAKRLDSVVKAAYPIGSIVLVEIGRSLFEAEILSHNDVWWSSPGEMVGRNLKTGKDRKFNYYNIKLDL